MHNRSNCVRVKLRGDTMGNDAKGMAVGVIGLGAMGLGIAQSLRRARFDVRVFDVRRDAAETFARDGAAVIKIFPGIRLPEKKQ